MTGTVAELVTPTETEMVQAKESSHQHEEWIRNVLSKRSDLNPSQLERTRQLMNAHLDPSFENIY